MTTGSSQDGLTIPRTKWEGTVLMAVALPDNPRLANDSERRVWEALLDQLREGDLVIAGQRVTDHLKDHEIDFVVAIEGAGIVCVEVKGGEVWHDGTRWLQKKRNGQVREIHPVRQAREACYALRDFIEADPRWTQGRLRWDHVVVLPNSALSQDFALPACPRWKVVDRDELSVPGGPAQRRSHPTGTRTPAARRRRRRPATDRAERAWPSSA